eukprot:366031-Chlamydomonas_euryale.AAC.17
MAHLHASPLATGHQEVFAEDPGQAVVCQGSRSDRPTKHEYSRKGDGMQMPPTRCAITFIKTVNYNHLMPTRYTLDVDFKGVVSGEVIDNSTKKVEAAKVRPHAHIWVMPMIVARCGMNRGAITGLGRLGAIHPGFGA